MQKVQRGFPSGRRAWPGAPACFAAATPTRLEGPPSPHLALLPVLTSLTHVLPPQSRQGPHPTLSQARQRVRKALGGSVGRCIGIDGPQGSHPSPRRGRLQKGHLDTGRSSLRRRAAPSQAGILKACRMYRLCSMSQAQGCRGEHHRSLRVYKLSQGPLVPYKQQVLTKLPERPTPTKQRPLSLTTHPQKARRQKQKQENLRGRARKPGFSHETGQTPMFRFT